MAAISHWHFLKNYINLIMKFFKIRWMAKILLHRPTGQCIKITGNTSSCIFSFVLLFPFQDLIILKRCGYTSFHHTHSQDLTMGGNTYQHNTYKTHIITRKHILGSTKPDKHIKVAHLDDRLGDYLCITPTWLNAKQVTSDKILYSSYKISSPDYLKLVSLCLWLALLPWNYDITRDLTFTTGKGLHKFWMSPKTASFFHVVTFLMMSLSSDKIDFCMLTKGIMEN